MNGLTRDDLYTVLDGLDVLLGSYGPDVMARVKATYKPGTDERKRVLALVDTFHLQLAQLDVP